MNTPNARVQRTANSAAKIAIGYANFIAIFTAPFAAFDAGVRSIRMYRILVVLILIGCSNVSAETKAYQSATAIMFSKQALLGYQLSMRNQYKQGKINDSQLKCINEQSYDKFMPVFQAILKSEMSTEELRNSDIFYGGSVGQKIQKYADEQTYMHAGIKPTEHVEISSSEVDEYNAFINTTAGQKILVNKVMDKQSSKMKHLEKIKELILLCDVNPTGS